VQWFNIVRWVYFALLTAEELGVSSANVDEMKNSTNPEIQRLLSVKVTASDGTEASNDFGAGLGLGPDWAYNAIKQVGNYAEIFERNLAQLKIARGENALWKDGGLQYSPPIR
jgi:general L-amino acid transport system substrate-binding protein